MEITHVRSRRPPARVVLSLIALFGFGVLILLFVAIHKFSGYEVAWEFARDLGIGLMVSASVAGLFELYRSVRHQIETMRDVLDVTMGEFVTPEVWLELKGLIETRKVIRRDVSVRWELIRKESLPSYQAVLLIEHEYALHGLANKTSEFTIEHELDYHLREDSLRLPSFRRAIVDPPNGVAIAYEGNDIDRKCPNGKLSFEVKLPERGQDPVKVRIERQELVYVPGSYNLYTPELTKGLRVIQGNCLPEIEPTVWVRPEGRGLNLKHDGNYWSCEHLLLPGQGIEIKFSLKPGNSQTETPAPANVAETVAEIYPILVIEDTDLSEDED